MQINTIISTFLLLNLITFTVSFSGCKPNTFSGVFTNNEIAEFLDGHNKYRADVANGKSVGATGTLPQGSNINQLVWNQELADFAKTWALKIANNCLEFSHNPSKKTTSFSTVGENLAWDYVSGYTPKTTVEMIKYANDAWYNEVKAFSSSTIPKYTTSSLGVTGHFAQMVWSNIRYVGCAYAYWSDSQWDAIQLIVCNYSDWMMYGEPMYLLGTPCSKCTDSTSKCSTKWPGLCETTLVNTGYNGTGTSSYAGNSGSSPAPSTSPTPGTVTKASNMLSICFMMLIAILFNYL